MRYLLFLLSVMLLAGGCRKDVLHWQKVVKLDSHTISDRLNKILFINDSIGFVVGGQRFYNSTVLKTKDRGNTWTYQNIADAPKAIYGITQAPSGTLYAVAFDGKFLTSTDTGETWSVKQIWYLPYNDLAFFNDERGLIVGGVSFNQGYPTYITKDGRYSAFDSLGYQLNDIEMINGRAGYIAAFGVVLKTEDSGTTWNMLDIKNDNFTAVHAYGPDEAWTCGSNGSIFHTSDGGKSWERMRNGNDLTKPRYFLNDIVFTDHLHGFAVGNKGLLIYSDDAGHHWMEFDRFTSSALHNIAVLKDGSLLVCGEEGALYKVFPKLLQ